jgi:hypothetical protein
MLICKDERVCALSQKHCQKVLHTLSIHIRLLYVLKRAVLIFLFFLWVLRMR